MNRETFGLTDLSRTARAGRSLHGWLPIFPVCARTRITHYLNCNTNGPDVVFYSGVDGWLSAYAEWRYAPQEESSGER